MMNEGRIPVMPSDALRVNVAVERSLYVRAKELKIDIHALFRMTLQDAVDALESRPAPEKAKELADFFVSELNRPPSRQRVAKAVAQAKGPFPKDKRA